jgi:hypothetical protein
MTKRLLMVMLVLALVLASCQSLTGQGEKTTGKTVDIPEGTPMPNCTVVSANPTPEPTLAAIFPPPGKGDWIDGEDTAFLTITEYSDFM